MKRRIRWTVLLGIVLAGGVFAFGISDRSAERQDCPGKIVCPLTGDLVCRDRCPLDGEQKKVRAIPECCQKGN